MREDEDVYIEGYVMVPFKLTKPIASKPPEGREAYQKWWINLFIDTATDIESGKIEVGESFLDSLSFATGTTTPNGGSSRSILMRYDDTDKYDMLNRLFGPLLSKLPAVKKLLEMNNGNS